MDDRVISHANDAINKPKTNGSLHIAACKRFLKDLDRTDFSYVWKPELAQRVINFAESLTIGEGIEKRKVTLYDHQCFDLGNLFGWVHRETGFRRYRRSYISMGRQNGKSFMNGILGTYICGFLNYKNGKLFTAATKKRQARLVWEEMLKFIRSDDDLEKLFRVQDWKSVITSLATNNTIEALSKEGGLDEGFRSIFASLDELHQMKDNAIYSSLYRGTRALDETLISMITTRGKDLNTFAYEMDKYCRGILTGANHAEDFFVDIYAMDDGDDYFAENTMKKANPYLMHDMSGWKNLKDDAKTARDMGGRELSEYITKSLNYWYRDSNNDYIDIRSWEDTEGTLDITGRSCFVGLDLSSGGDLTSIGFNFETDDGKEYFTSHSFMPRGRFREHMKSDQVPYDVWEEEGLLTLTGGEGDYITDYLYIVDYLHEFIEKHHVNVLGIGYDNHNISSLLPYLDDFGVPLMDIKQSARFLNDATNSIRLKVKSGKVVHDEADSLLTWGMTNARIISNSFGEIKVDKYDGAQTKRIDPVDAIIDAHAFKLLSVDNHVNLDDRILSNDWSL